ncbi:uncharacterized protein BX663DRAFT_345295 [Cokeromyces recurvatus]|uniref:uncharacterized protein n=1 Tax=Cokeromyces recurvatus TaxID=90255 RepID=UPI00221FF309|nr:uncharacterized protein BX663DRAFT_345295 [Cokeromyces recurvatus]KAI7903805.1 hypothetical protein BX663DRAFT_345295 [Cokeromyces recurvatus]
MASVIFPFKGIYFLLTHPKQLWLKTLSPILLTMIFSVFSIGISIKFLLPQLVGKLLEWHWPHWMSWFISIISTIVESAILNLIFFAILVPIFQDAVFDATLRARGLDRIFDEEEEHDIPKYVLCWRSSRSSILVTWCLITVKILLMLLTAPLQLIPFAGTALACTINGWPTAWSQRLHYDIELRGYKVSDSYHHAREHAWNYVGFGSFAFALELVPFFNIIFVWSNIVSAGLWLADEYEKEIGLVITKKEKVSKNMNYGAVQAPTVYSVENENTPLLSSTSYK